MNQNEKTTEFQFQKHIKIVVGLSVGEKVTISGWGYQLDNKTHIIQEIKTNFGGSESGIMVKINNYPDWIDSNWVDKIKQ